MTDFVLDASITLSWFFSDEMTTATNELLERLDNETAYVPSIWALEIGNILVGAERKKRITYAGISQFLEQLSKLNIHIEHDTTFRGFHEVLSLAHSEGLTTYDASYLEIALRRGLPLASKDQQLCNVAKRLGVNVINPSFFSTFDFWL